jgi:hypothetical protein
MMYLKYLKYLLIHKWYVLCECFKARLYWRGIMHDMSKFRPDEFIPYARYFYGEWQSQEHADYIFKVIQVCIPHKDTNECVKEAFDRAWLKHIHRNPHHHQHWLLANDSDGTYPLEMPKQYGLEMICDWRGAGKAITGKDDVCAWYEKNKDNMVLHPTTRRTVESALTFIARQKKGI